MEVLPNIFEERVHNLEIYAQKQIFQRMTILNDLPMNQNPVGTFTNMMASENPDPETGNPITTSEGVTFTEIKFGKPSETRGAIRPKGFMFRVSDQVERNGQLDSTLQIFINKSIGRFINFYDDLFLKSLTAGAGATAPDDLVPITPDMTGFDVIENEYKIIDAMEYQNDNDTGFKPTKAYTNRKDALTIKMALAKADLTDDSEIEYVPTSRIAQGNQTIVDMVNPTASIEKFTNQKYSILAKMEAEAPNGRIYDKYGNPIPQSFINMKEAVPEEPERTNYYIFTSAGLNIKEPHGIMSISNS